MKASTVFELEADGYTHLACHCNCGAAQTLSFHGVRSAMKGAAWSMTAAQIGSTLQCPGCVNAGMTVEPVRRPRVYRGGPYVNAPAMASAATPEDRRSQTDQLSLLDLW